MDKLNFGCGRIVATGVLLASTLAQAATTYYVSAMDGDDANDGLSREAPLKSLARFVGDSGSEALKGATLVLSPGTYVVEETLWLQNATICSADGNPETTVLDGQGKCQVVYTGYPRGWIYGVTIQNGRSDENSKGSLGGAGIHISSDAQNVISNCIIRNCQASYAGAASAQVGGGGVYLRQGQLLDCVVSNCTFTLDGEKGTAVGGGVCAMDGVKLVGNRIADCRMVFASGSRCGGGGLGFFGDLAACSMSDNQIEDCAVVDAAGAAVQYGGGCYVDLAANGQLSDLMIRGCRASYGGGLALRTEGCAVVSSTLTNNTATLSGGGVYVNRVGDSQYGARAFFTNCLIVANAAQGNTADNGGGGAYVVAGTKSSIDAAHERVAFVGCAVLNNTTVGKGGGICFDWYRGNNALLDNCCIAGNTASRAGGGIYSYAMHDGRLRSTFVLDNRATDGAAIYADAAEGELRDDASTNWQISNCYIKGNEASGIGILYLCGVPEKNFCRIDHSTVVGNNLSEASASKYAFDYRQMENTRSSATNLFVEACVVYGNGADGLRNFAFASGVEPLNVSRTYATGIPFGDARGNFSPETLAPESTFADWEAGDWRLARKNALVDVSVDGEAFDWMRPRAVTDMGDGTFTLQPVANHGVCVVPGNARRRWHGEALDVGCFELNYRRGCALIIR